LIAALRQAGDADRRRLRRLAMRRRWTAREWGQLKTLVERCGGFEYARARALAHADVARKLLASESGGAARQALDRAIDYAVRRDH
ncbi:MAG: hypothetical protein ACRENJ_06980, partial [Candidatus Eiseniibacteriota bacterium]